MIHHGKPASLGGAVGSGVAARARRLARARRRRGAGCRGRRGRRGRASSRTANVAGPVDASWRGVPRRLPPPPPDEPREGQVDTRVVGEADAQAHAVVSPASRSTCRRRNSGYERGSTASSPAVDRARADAAADVPQPVVASRPGTEQIDEARVGESVSTSTVHVGDRASRHRWTQDAGRRASSVARQDARSRSSPSIREQIEVDAGRSSRHRDAAATLHDVAESIRGERRSASCVCHSGSSGRR